MLEKRVQELEENELVEEIMMRGSQVQEDTPESSNNVDEIMRRMIGSTLSNTSPEASKEDPYAPNPSTRETREDVFGR